MRREDYICGDLAYNNAKVAELCGHPKVLIALEKKCSIHNKHRKIGRRKLVRKNANKFAHSA
jgi:hypothetical protein|tara:strand:- start:3567 stop:3752 length:186 start_codon:yes stop_codon:yes gene_type:complete